MAISDAERLLAGIVDAIVLLLELDDAQRRDCYGAVWMSPYARKWLERLVAGEITSSSLEPSDLVVR